MSNNLFLWSAVGVISWVFVSGTPAVKPVDQSSRVAAADSSASSYVGAGHSFEIEARQDPVPLVRKVRTPSPPSAETVETPTTASPQTPMATAEQEDLDRKAAKAAAEQDGYKRVIIIGKANNGAWRAKGSRGTTEVMLTVDGTGRVSMD